LGINLGGVDKRLRRGEFYPGAVQFSYEISTYGGRFVAAVVPLSVAVLTARARELKFALALRPSGKLCSQYSSYGKSHGNPNWGVGQVYYGSVVEWLFQNKKGIRKFHNFEKLLKEDAAAGLKLQYIIIGDTGERDEDAAERIVAQYPSRIKAIFLHAVKVAGPSAPAPSASAPGGCAAAAAASDAPGDRVANGVPFFYFRTYVGAAVTAYRHGLLDKDGLARVVDQSTTELNTILTPSSLSPFRNLKFKLSRKNVSTILLQGEFKKDITAAQKILT
jgi:hypothetical protein